MRDSYHKISPIDITQGSRQASAIEMQFSTLATFAVLVAVGSAQGITKVNAFSTGPTKVGMYVYAPKSLQSPAPILVAVHHCQGSAQQYSTESKYISLADKHNFIVIYPNSKSSGGCFDVASTASTYFDISPSRASM